MKTCTCCHESIDTTLAEIPSHDGEEYCSWECIEHVEEQEQEYLDSLNV